MTKKLILLFCMAISTATLLSCVRAEKDATTNVTLSFATPPTSMHANELNPDGTINASSLNDLTCYVVLVSGPEAAMSNNLCTYKDGSSSFTVGKLRGGFYVGVRSASSDTTTVEAKEIPIGKSRTIRLVGFKIAPPTAAPNSGQAICENFILTDALQKYVSDPYQISQLDGVDLTGGSSQTVDMTAAFDSTKKVGDCKGPAFPDNGTGGGSSAGKPAQFGISLQDGVGASGSGEPLKPNSCVAVRFQVQDSSGNRASITAGSNLMGLIQHIVNGDAVGTFYSPGSNFCVTGALSSSDISQAFYNGSGDFTDAILLYRPNVPSSSDGGLIIVDNGGTGLAEGNLTFNRTTATSTPMTYGVYDLYNNVSSYGPAALKVVDGSKCRAGAVQFFDQNNVPTTLTTSTGSFRSIIVSSDLSPSQIKFYPNSDCTGGSGDHTIAFPIAPFQTYGSLSFTYKLNGLSAATVFKMQAFNDPASGAAKALPSGDQTTGLDWSIK